jgi:UDP-glucose-4-epimerase GalE
MQTPAEIPRGAAILVTGGAGYIGAHTCKALQEKGYTPVVYDDLSSGFREAVRWGPLVVGDIRDGAALRSVMQQHAIRAVIHFAGLIEVGRSMSRPDLFYDANVNGLACVLDAMRDHEIGRIVFSSSAAVYGQKDQAGSSASLTEADPKNPVSPYGDTKLAGEKMIAAYARAFGFQGVALRYFNAAGADPSGLIGEAHDPETHLIPLALAAALGHGPPLTLFGADFPTEDGTCVRDYVHVSDLASAHVAALSMERVTDPFTAMNLGVGEGHSVRQVLQAVEREVGQAAPCRLGERRAGDPARLVADPGLALRLLGWTPSHSSLDEIVRTAAAWHRAPAYGRGPAARA